MVAFLVRLLFIGVVGYGVIAAIMYAMQRSFQYAPDRSLAGSPQDVGLHDMRAVMVDTEDGLRLQAWYQPPKKQDGKVIVYFHGNAGHHGHRSTKIAHFIDAGYGVYLCGYRGYGGNPGRPSEAGFYRDAHAAIAWLKNSDVKTEQMVFYGESIGAGVAVQMAGEYIPAALILEAPFTSAIEMGKLRYGWLPVDLLLRDRFDNLAKISLLKTDLLVVHGDADAVTPIALGKRLFDAARHPKEFIAINNAGHGDLYEHRAGSLIVEWLQKRGDIQ